MPQPDVIQLVEAVQEAAGTRFVAAYRFGSDIARGKGKGRPRVLLLVDAIDRDFLDGLAPAIREGREDGIRVRLDTRDNLVRGSDAFPAFAFELIRHRELIAGDDVLRELQVQEEHLRLHVEHGLRGIFRDLVAGYLDGKIHGESVLEVRRSARRLVFLLEGTLLAAKKDVPDPATFESIAAAVRKDLLPSSDATAWKTLEAFIAGDHPLHTDGVRTLYGAMLTVLGELIEVVDHLDD